nr:hypothetical protein [Nocardioides zhouii]
MPARPARSRTWSSYSYLAPGTAQAQGQQAGRDAAQAGLGVGDPGAGGGGEQPPGDGVAELAAQRHPTVEGPRAEDESTRVWVGDESFADGDDVVQRVLAVGVRADHGCAGSGRCDVGEPGLEGGALSAVGRQGDDLGPGRAGRLEETGVRRSGTVVDDEQRPVGAGRPEVGEGLEQGGTGDVRRHQHGGQHGVSP